MVIGRNAKLVLALAAILVILMFSEMNAGTLLATLVGAALVMLGIASYYRPASMAGLMIAAGSAAVSNDPGSLTVLASWLNAVLGLLVPIYVLTWVSLNSGSEESSEIVFRSKASAYTVMFILACILSVPIAALVMGFVSPRFSVTVSVLTEVAIMLTVATAGLILLTSQRPQKGTIAEPTSETGSE